MGKFYFIYFLVPVAPQRPRLEHDGAHVPPGHNVTVDSSATATVKCVSHYGNPPAMLKWFLGKFFLSFLCTFNYLCTVKKIRGFLKPIL